MNFGYILVQNLRRNRLRTVLTLLAFALPMAVFVAAISLVVAMARIGKENEKHLRLAVHHKTTITNMLPEGGRRKIEALDPTHTRIAAICGTRWFGGRVPDTQNTLTSLAADADTFPLVYADSEMTPAELEDWQRERSGCVVGKVIAEQYNWEKGRRVTLNSTVPPYLSLEFKIVAVMQNPTKANYFYFRRDYLQESLKSAGSLQPDLVNIFWVKCNSVAELHRVQPEIDALFANSPDETKTEDENAFFAGFTQAAGNIPGLMQAMAVVVVFIIALVAGNTMMMSFRERTRELAVFKAIGFSRRRVFGLVLGESMLLALFGAVLGVLPAAVGVMYASSLMPASMRSFGPLTQLRASPAAVGASLGIGLAVGLAAGLWPAWQAMRMRTTDALRRVA